MRPDAFPQSAIKETVSAHSGRGFVPPKAGNTDDLRNSTGKSLNITRPFDHPAVDQHKVELC
jgi:hypothetical protein